MQTQADSKLSTKDQSSDMVKLSRPTSKQSLLRIFTIQELCRNLAAQYAESLHKDKEKKSEEPKGVPLSIKTLLASRSRRQEEGKRKI